MDTDSMLELFRGYKRGEVPEERILDFLRHLPYKDVGGFARLDHHRAVRQGFPEVIYSPGKSVEQICGIVRTMSENGSDILATRADFSVFEAVKRIEPAAVYHRDARMIVVQKKRKQAVGLVVVVSAGTSDIPVASEAKLTAEVMGSKVETLYDVGVAGIHRLLHNMDRLSESSVVIVVAGMDGALPSVVGGLVPQPVVAVPTSVGYGASFNGLAALLSMLNSCAVGVSVVNIDNGFGAGVLAHKINVQSKIAG